MTEHERLPPWTAPTNCQTSDPPTAYVTGRRLQAQMNHLINWAFTPQIFAYSGPPELTINPSAGIFYLILSGPEKTDAANDDRNIIISWLRWDAPAGAGSVDPGIDWIDPLGNTQTIMVLDYDTQSVTLTSGYGDELDLGDAEAAIWDTDGDRIIWQPNGTDEFRVGKVDFQGVQFAALSIWETPQIPLTDAQVEIVKSEMSVGQVIRGYDGTHAVSLGGLLHKIGEHSDVHSETAYRVGRRCWQWGHQIGVWTDSTSYVNMFGGAANPSPLIFKPRKLTAGTKNIECKPAFIVTATNKGGDCYIKVTNIDNADTWEWSGNNKTAALIKYDDGTPATGIDFSNSAREEFKIELKCDAGEEITIHTASIWEGSSYD
ncbi:MAG: hypothetical protein GY832_23675 [Chloroflexi bacterium]|nr:hypothetical protein [Chloroflexota bacterium]